MPSSSLRAKSLWQRIKEHREYYIMLLPALAFVIIFNYLPMYGIIVAFKDYYSTKGIWGSAWVGFANFKQIFALQKFWQVIRNTLEINVLRLVFDFPAPIILALMLNEVRSQWFKRLTQTIVYLPHFISWVVISGILFNILSSDGLFNTIIIMLGGKPVQFLSNSSTFRPLLVITQIWKEVGWGTIIYLAALSGISPEYYEAAMIDGAGRFKQIFYITLPFLAPTVSIMLILRVGQMMNGGFDQVFNLINPSVYDVGDVIDTYIYRIGLVDGRFSQASAVGLFLNVINCILLLTVNKVSQKIGGAGLY